MRTLLCSLCVLVLTFTAKSVVAQSVDKESLHFAYLDKEVEITRERIFEGAGLFGFMNGGAELFLEYGFQQMLEQRLTYQEVPFVVEYYLMDSPENGYGIYAVHAFKCVRIDERFPIECLTPGLLQLYHGHLYINIKCMDRSIDSQPLLDSLSTLIINKNPIDKERKTLDLSSFPPPYSQVLYYVCGDLGLSAAHISWAQLFAPYTHYAMWLRIDPESGEVTAQVHFASENDAEAFCVQNESLLRFERKGSEVFIK